MVGPCGRSRSLTVDTDLPSSLSRSGCERAHRAAVRRSPAAYASATTSGTSAAANAVAAGITTSLLGRRRRCRPRAASTRCAGEVRDGSAVLARVEADEPGMLERRQEVGGEIARAAAATGAVRRAASTPAARTVSLLFEVEPTRLRPSRRRRRRRERPLVLEPQRAGRRWRRRWSRRRWCPSTAVAVDAAHRDDADVVGQQAAVDRERLRSRRSKSVELAVLAAATRRSRPGCGRTSPRRCRAGC